MIDQQLIIEKLDKLADKQAEMTAILAVQAKQLEYHIARTDALEAMLHDNYEHLDDRLKPVQEHVSMLKGAGKVAAAAATVTGLLLAAAKLLFR